MLLVLLVFVSDRIFFSQLAASIYRKNHQTRMWHMTVGEEINQQQFW